MSSSNATVSSSKLVIFGASPLRLLHRVLAAGAFELVEHDLSRVEVQTVCEEQRIGQHIGQFVGDTVAVRLRLPLEAFERSEERRVGKERRDVVAPAGWRQDGRG